MGAHAFHFDGFGYVVAVGLGLSINLGDDFSIDFDFHHAPSWTGSVHQYNILTVVQETLCAVGEGGRKIGNVGFCIQ